MTDAWGEHFRVVYEDNMLTEVKVESQGDLQWRKQPSKASVTSMDKGQLKVAQEAQDNLDLNPSLALGLKPTHRFNQASGAAAGVGVGVSAVPPPAEGTGGVGAIAVASAAPVVAEAVISTAGAPVPATATAAKFDGVWLVAVCVPVC